jgi:hypothetical protein
MLRSFAITRRTRSKENCRVQTIRTRTIMMSDARSEFARPEVTFVAFSFKYATLTFARQVPLVTKTICTWTDNDGVTATCETQKVSLFSNPNVFQSAKVIWTVSNFCLLFSRNVTFPGNRYGSGTASVVPHEQHHGRTRLLCGVPATIVSIERFDRIKARIHLSVLEATDERYRNGDSAAAVQFKATGHLSTGLCRPI